MVRMRVVTRLALATWIAATAPALAALKDEPSRNAPTEAGLTEALIVNIQDGLATLGFYKAANRGRLDDATIAAIRAYQAAWNLPQDGVANVKLFDHVTTSLQMRRVTTQLEVQSAAEDAQARQALLESPETRDLVSPGSQAALPVTTFETCLAAPNPACLLAAAVNSAASERATWLKDWALGEIVAIQARAGLANEARATLRQMTDARLIVVSLRDIAGGLARGGRMDEARSTAATVPDITHRMRALLDIAAAETAKNPQAALKILRQILTDAATIPDPAQRMTTIAAAATGLHRAGDNAGAVTALTSARRLLETGKTGPDRAGATAIIATAFADIDRPNEAAILLRQVNDQTVRIPALLALVRSQARNGQADAALATLDGVTEPRFRATALADMAVDRSKTADDVAIRTLLVQSLDTGAAIQESYARSYTVAAAARAMIDLNWIDESAKLARTIVDPGLRAQSLWRVASLQAKRGVAEGPGTELQAVVATAAVESRLTRVWILVEAASSRIREGDRDGARRPLDRAIKEAAAIPVGWTNARALARIADAFIELQ